MPTPKDKTTTAPATTDVATPPADNKTLAKLKADYEAYPNATLRRVSFELAPQLLGKPMTWAQFCKMKKDVQVQYWDDRAKDPNAHKVIKKLTKEKAAKIRQRLADMKRKEAEYEAALASIAE